MVYLKKICEHNVDGLFVLYENKLQFCRYYNEDFLVKND